MLHYNVTKYDVLMDMNLHIDLKYYFVTTLIIVLFNTVDEQMSAA